MFKITLNLALACLFSGTILALTYYITAPVAAYEAEQMKVNSMKQLIKDASTFEAAAEDKEIFIAKKESTVLGYIVASESKGFSGTIRLLVAISPDLKVQRYDIISHNETPGLGDKADKPAFKDQFFQKTLQHLNIVKDPKDSESVQAITGATITSRAVNEAVKKAINHLSEFLKGA